MRQFKTKGFTLIEVMIAAIILFTSIALVAELFSSSSLSSNKAIQNAVYAQIIPIANRIITHEVQATAKNRSLTSFKGQLLLFDINFEWTAERRLFSPPPLSSSDDSPNDNKIGLFDVSVSTLSNKQKQYLLQVVTW